MKAKPIRLLVVDDSALARKIIAKSLAPFSDIELAGTATDPYAARDKILALAPDVITLDIEMPRMDGITFLKIIMKHRPTPVIIMSSLTPSGSIKVLEALEAGAVEVMGKPGSAYSAQTDGARLAEKIRAAASARVGPCEDETEVITGIKKLYESSHHRATSQQPIPARKIILLGASTGGTEALKTLLMSMRGDLPGICIVQHIPGGISKAFAERLNHICPMAVREAVHGDTVQPGCALIAPGGKHLLLKWKETHYAVELNDGPPLHHQRPSVDIMFYSAVNAGAGPHAAAALLTGMGGDGAAGLLKLREAGAATAAQNEESCVVFGMPREAVRLGAAQQVLALSRIGAFLEGATLADSQAINK